MVAEDQLRSENKTLVIVKMQDIKLSLQKIWNWLRFGVLPPTRVY